MYHADNKYKKHKKHDEIQKENKGSLISEIPFLIGKGLSNKNVFVAVAIHSPRFLPSQDWSLGPICDKTWENMTLGEKTFI